jgi:hypothetical protein
MLVLESGLADDESEILASTGDPHPSDIGITVDSPTLPSQALTRNEQSGVSKLLADPMSNLYRLSTRDSVLFKIDIPVDVLVCPTPTLVALCFKMTSSRVERL